MSQKLWYFLKLRKPRGPSWERSLFSSSPNESGMGFAVKDRRMVRQRGFSLLELLVVIALLGLLALIATVQVRHLVQKNELRKVANEVTSFLQGVPDLVAKKQTALFVLFSPHKPGQQARLQVAEDAAGTKVLRTLALPSTVVFSLSSLTAVDTTWPTNGGVYLLRCDTINRTTDPTKSTNPQLQQEATLLLTHRNMVLGNLTPKYGFQVAVAPVWSVRATRK
jgi:prepilin-type N-terminal cleavage/methylation domain-containing protein